MDMHVALTDEQVDYLEHKRIIDVLAAQRFRQRRRRRAGAAGGGGQAGIDSGSENEPEEHTDDETEEEDEADFSFEDSDGEDEEDNGSVMDGSSVDERGDANMASPQAAPALVRAQYLVV